MLIYYASKGITVFQSIMCQTTSTVAVTEDLILIVDPTWLPGEIEAIRKHVDHIDEGQQKYIFFTHSDFDHVLGYNAFPDAITIASQGVADHSKKEAIVQEIKDFDGTYYIERPYRLEYPKIDIIIDQNVQLLKEGATTLSFYLTSGHTADGAAVFIPHAKTLAAGDYLSDVEFPFIYDHSEAYKATLDVLEATILEQDVQLLVPGHGSVTTKKKEMTRRIKESRWYIKELQKQIKDDKNNEASIQSFINTFTFSSHLKPMHEDNKKQIRDERML